MLNVENLLDQSSKKDIDIYRIIPFERLIEIYSEKKLTLISPAKWQDPFEQHWMNVLYPDKNVRAQKLKSIYGLCLSKESRSDALWRIYSPSMLGVRIKLKASKLIEQLNQNRNTQGDAYLGMVNYLKDSELIEISRNIQSSNGSLSRNQIKSWLNKRLAFKHEAEIRLLLVTEEKDNVEEIIKLDIDPESLIESVNVDPRASPDLANALIDHIKKITGKNGRFVHQSSLYKLPSELETP